MSTAPAPGQFGVVRTNGFVAAAIRLLTRSQVSHAFLVINDREVIEAQARGAVFNPLTKYDGYEVVYSQIPLSSAEIVAVTQEASTLHGTPYNYLDLVALGLHCLGVDWPWVKNRAQRSDRLICSQLVDRAYELAGVHLFNDGRPDGTVTPGDLLMWVAADQQPTFDHESKS